MTRRLGLMITLGCEEIMRTLHVSALVDIMGTSMATPEQEYEAIRRDIEENLSCKVVMRTDVQPHNLGKCDLYVFDFGGMMPGCGDLTDSLHRELLNKIQEMPSVVFWILSTFTALTHKEVAKQEYPELVDCPYVVVADDYKKLEALLGVGQGRATNAKPGLKKPGRGS